jgi:hypothetical protein
MNNFKLYRKFKGGIWYKHYNTFQLSGLYFKYFWSNYNKINKFTKVIKIENYE